MTGTGRGGRRELLLEAVGLDLGGHRVLEGIDLRLDAGSQVALTGPSGAGKTVLCLVLAGALRPTSGRVVVDGSDWGDDGRPTVGFVLQSHGLVDGLTAAENVALLLQARRMEPDEMERRTHQALAQVGLAGEAERMVEELSGGERQRVGIARAIAGDPDVLVADEPTAELDPENRARVLELIADVAARGGIVVVASDDPEVLVRFPVVVHLQGGTIVTVVDGNRRGAPSDWR